MDGYFDYLIVEFLFKKVIVNFFGKKSRYIFYKIIGKPKSMEYLAAKNTINNYQKISQFMSNVIVGFIVFIAILFIGLSSIWFYLISN